MNRRAALRTLGIACAAQVWPRASAQEPFVIHSNVRLVLLDVAVKDHRGGFASGLQKDNFAVFENGKLQTITVFDDEDLPVTVGLLVDESRSMTPKRSEVLSAALIFIERSNPHDEVFVLNFNDVVKRGLSEGTLFSDDARQLRTALYQGVPEGKTAMNDAIVAGLGQLEQGRRDKKALILISDGGDNASQATRGEMLGLVERSLATIYAIGIYDPQDFEKNPGVLRRLANISGGEAYFPTQPEQASAICQGIAKEIRTRYTVGYIPTAPSPSLAAGSLRHIHVAVSAPGRPSLAARTRTSYRYDLLETKK
jgi:Ca-activated chloride channel homolog